MPTSVTSSSGRQSATEHLCYHCNEPCPDERLRQDDKYFCCEGCKLVYEILDEHGLCDFYALDKNAGVSLKQSKSAKAYAFLDDDEIQEKLLEFNSADKRKKTD